jgi:hypothetical protein
MTAISIMRGRKPLITDLPHDHTKDGEKQDDPGNTLNCDAIAYAVHAGPFVI